MEKLNLYSNKNQSTENNLISSTLIMVRPIDFAFNEETAEDNEFQKKPECNQEMITINALKEFDNLVEKLKLKGINVLVHDKSKYIELTKYKTPDSCFPNNWISNEPNGYIFTYPLYAPNRRLERLAFSYIEKQLLEDGFEIKGTFNIGTSNQDNKFLEGTGSMIFDRQNKIIYAAKSLRTNEDTFNEFLSVTGYEGISFETCSTIGKQYYHTNMILCIGDSFVIICKDAIVKDDQQKVMDKLNNSGKEILEISREQAEKFCCGNVLQVRSDKDKIKRYIVMSENAFNGYTAEQKEILKKYGEIIYSDIQTIEQIGGGSVRCMLCEVYLPKNNL